MNVAHLTSSLVRIESENPPGKTADVVEFIGEFLDSLGVKYRIISHPGGRDNLITTKPDPGILLCGHVDVVPAIPDDWTHDPYGGEIADGYVWGGGTDMKVVRRPSCYLSGHHRAVVSQRRSSPSSATRPAAHTVSVAA